MVASFATQRKQVIETMECSSVQKLLHLLSIEESLSPELRLAINEKAKYFLEGLAPEVAHFLHYELNDVDYTEDDIRTLVQCVPSSMSVEDEDGRLPIENAVWRYTSNNTLMDISAVSFTPLLAEEGIKHQVGGEGTRGGLLRADEDECNALNHLSRISENDREIDHATFDLHYLHVMRKLRELGLLKKKDIKEHDLLWESCESIRSHRFNYLSDWQPDLLRELQDEDAGGDSLLHWCSSLCDIRIFQTALRATMRHFPREFGLLLLENCQGYTPLRKAYDQFGKEETWKVVHMCLDETDAGMNTILVQKDPAKNIYPFMLAAAGDTSELDLIFTCLRQDPIVLEQLVADRVVERMSSPLLRKRKNVSHYICLDTTSARPRQY